MNAADILWVGLAGSTGAAARFIADGSVRSRFDLRLPAGTMAINLVGSLLLGVLTGLVLYHHASSTLVLVAGTGFCGGFTTFSTATFETVRLIQQGNHRMAAINCGMTVIGAIAAAALGLALAYL
ncbi:MAG: fluoride efflux transporter CrcB [Acidimicrobiales bacterium]